MFWDEFLARVKSLWQPAETTIIGIDIGTTKIAAVVATVDKSGMRILGMSSIPFNGFNWIGETRVSTTADAIRSLAIEAFKVAGYSTRSTVIGISAITKGINSKGLVPADRKITRRDIQRAVAVAADITIPDDMVMLDQVINRFTIDDLIDTGNPLGMAGSRLEAHSHIVLGRRTVMKAVNEACNLAGLKIKLACSSELSAATTLLSPDERQQGVCLVDIGGGHTTMIVYESGALCYTTSIPWGGNHLSSCIGLHLGLNMGEAEKIKIEASQHETLDDCDMKLETVRALLNERVREFCALLNSELHKSGLKEQLGAGVVLTGRASRLPGLAEAVADIFKLPVRRGVLLQESVPSEYASAVGLVMRTDRLKSQGVSP